MHFSPSFYFKKEDVDPSNNFTCNNSAAKSLRILSFKDKTN